MEKIPVIYWSGTGNTKLMAEAVAEGIGTAADLKSVSDITPEHVLPGPHRKPGKADRIRH